MDTQSSSMLFSFPEIDRFIVPIPSYKIQQAAWNDGNQQLHINKYDQYLKSQIIQPRRRPKQKLRCNKLYNCSFLKRSSKNEEYKQIKENSLKDIKIMKSFNSIPIQKMIDDFYLNLLDWSPKKLLGACFHKQFHFFKPYNQQYNKKIEPYDNFLSSLKFDEENLMAIGNFDGQIGIWDIQYMKQIRLIRTKHKKINCLSWFNSNLASGSSDGNIIIWDKRISNPCFSYRGHYKQTCGLKWNKTGQLLASGGNDINLFIFDTRISKNLVNFQYFYGAIKAIDWCHENSELIAAGGGAMDKTIRFFNTKTLNFEFQIKTNSQICNLSFSKVSNQMVTCHGYSLNQINVWSSSNRWREISSIKQVGTMVGHQSRVLNFAFNNEGDTMATTGGDKTLKFWHPFNKQNQQQLSFLGAKDLR